MSLLVTEWSNQQFYILSSSSLSQRRDKKWELSIIIVSVYTIVSNKTCLFNHAALLGVINPVLLIRLPGLR